MSILEQMVIENKIAIDYCNNIAEVLYKALEEKPYVYYIDPPFFDASLAMFMIHNKYACSNNTLSLVLTFGQKNRHVKLYFLLKVVCYNQLHEMQDIWLDELTEVLKEYKKILIWGTGTYGKCIYSNLCNEGFHDKIEY